MPLTLHRYTSMATLIINDISYIIPDGSRLEATCEAAGVPFSCHAGQCGTCQIEIYEGEDNLAPLNAKEEKMGMDIYNRLACQCVISQGTVKLGH